MKSLLVLTFSLGLSLLVFQNCAGTGFESVSAGSSLMNSDYHGDNFYDCEGTQCHDFSEKLEQNKYLSQVGNIDYVKSVFDQVFKSPNQISINDKIENILLKNLMSRRLFFGGRCTNYDENEDCYAEGNTQESRYNFRINQSYENLPVGGVMTASREGVRLQVCDLLLKEKDILESMLSNAGLEINSEINEENLAKLMLLFYPDLDPKEAVENLMSSHKDFYIDDKTEQWQKISGIVCYSSGWQYY